MNFQQHPSNFYPLMRSIERYYLNSYHEIIFVANMDLAFPVSDIAKLSTEKHIIKVTQNLMSLIGQNGILPDELTELLLSAINNKDFILRDFLDIFNSIILKQYYKAWKSTRFFINYEQSIHDYTLKLLHALVGISFHPYDKSLIELCLYHAEIMHYRVRCKEGLKALLQNYFNVSVSIQDLSGSWLIIDKEEHTRLNHLNQLGATAMLGSRSWCMDNNINIMIGPLEYSVYLEFLPNTEKLSMLKKIITLYCGHDYTYQIKFKINSTTVKVTRLDKSYKFHLGWNTWQSGRHPSSFKGTTSILIPIACNCLCSPAVKSL